QSAAAGHGGAGRGRCPERARILRLARSRHRGDAASRERPPEAIARVSRGGLRRMSRTTGLERGLTNYGDPDFAAYLRRSFAKSMGYSNEMLRRPIIGIATSASGFNNCHRLTPELVDAVKRGVLAAGGLPLEFPTISLGEVFLNPTSLMFRNLMAM